MHYRGLSQFQKSAFMHNFTGLPEVQPSSLKTQYNLGYIMALADSVLFPLERKVCIASMGYQVSVCSTLALHNFSLMTWSVYLLVTSAVPNCTIRQPPRIFPRGLVITRGVEAPSRPRHHHLPLNSGSGLTRRIFNICSLSAPPSTVTYI